MKKISRAVTAIFSLSIIFIVSGCLPEQDFFNKMSSDDIMKENSWIALRNGEEADQYYRKDNNIYWKTKIDFKIEGVSINTFRINTFFQNYAKDEKNAYSSGYAVPVDLASWIIIEEDHHKDKKNVYYGVHILPDADPQTFEVINYKATHWRFYGKDKNNVYYEWDKLENADPKTFEVHKNFSRDKENVFIRKNKITDADPETFEIFNEDKKYYRDKNSIFWNEQKLKEANPKTFAILQDYYSTDGKFVYHYAEKLPDADPGTLKFLEGGYAKDKKNVYYGAKKIENADPETFEIVNLSSFITKDKNFYYQYEKKDESLTKYLKK